MEYKYICPQCGKEEIFKKESTLLKKLENKEVCRRCKAKNKDLNTTYSRKCPECGKEILYKYKSDYNKASVKNSLCKSCAVKHSTIFTEGHTFNDLYNVPKNNLDKLLDESISSMYWVGFIIADGSIYNNYSRFEFGLKNSDIEVLKSFANYINYNGDIKHRESTNSNRIIFNSNKSIKTFSRHFGILENKTYNPVDFSIYKKYNKEQLLALLIGIIDGDGCIQSNGNSFSIKITAHNCWENFYTELLQALNIIVHINKVKDTNTVTIGIYKKDYIDMFLSLIDKYKITCLLRKWKQIMEVKDPLVSIS